MKLVLVLLALFILFFGCVTQTTDPNSNDLNTSYLDSNNDENSIDSNSSGYSNLDLYKKAKLGDLVLVHYTGKLENGEVFDTSKGREAFEVTIGTTPLISGFENALIGMKVGDKKTVEIPPKEGYGEIIY